MSRPLVTLERLREVLHYNPETGLLTYRIPRPRCRVGAVAGTPNNYGHLILRIDYRIYYAHILAWFYMTGRWPELLIDHKDCNPANNRWENLREATNAQNMQNSGRSKHNTSGFKGVQYFKQYAAYKTPWRAMIIAEGKPHFLGYFATPEAAHAAYAEAAARLHGEFARTV